MADIREVDTLKQLALEEYDSTTTGTKKSLVYGWDSAGLAKVRLKVDANGQVYVTGAGGSGSILDGVNTAIKATVLDYANSNPLAVRLTDTAGDYVTAGGGTQYADGAARGTATGTLAMGDDGTLIQSLKCDAAGELQIDVLSIATGNNIIGQVKISDGTDLVLVDASGNLMVNLGVKLAATTDSVEAKKGDTHYTKIYKYVALTGVTETAVWTPTAGKKFVITDIHISATAAGTCTLRDGTAGTVFWIGSFAANGGMVSNLQTPIQSATANNVLTAQASAITQYILICGYEI